MVAHNFHHINYHSPLDQRNSLENEYSLTWQLSMFSVFSSALAVLFCFFFLHNLHNSKNYSLKITDVANKVWKEIIRKWKETQYFPSSVLYYYLSNYHSICERVKDEKKSVTKLWLVGLKYIACTWQKNYLIKAKRKSV